MRELKKDIYALLKKYDNNVFFKNTISKTDNYICFFLNDGSKLDNIELLSLQIDLWTNVQDYEWLETTSQLIKKELNKFVITTEKMFLEMFYERQLYEIEYDDLVGRITLFFNIKYMEV